MDMPSVQYAKTEDGFNIAFAEMGKGEPLVLMPSQFSHIELYWTQETFVRPWLLGLAGRFRLVQYDGRGQGLSQRELPEHVSIDDLTYDLEAVVDRLELERFILVASQWWVHVAVRYAIEHRDRIHALVLASSAIRAGDMPTFRTGLTRPPALAATVQDWDGLLLTTLRVGQSTDVRAALARLKQTITPSDWLKLFRAAADSNLGHLLGQLDIPTLLLQPRDLFRSELAAQLAAAISGARVVYVDGAPPLGDAEPALQAIDEFLSSLPSPISISADNQATTLLSQDHLSSRQLEVLRLVALGKTNRQIAEILVLSERTVERHVADVYAKTGVSNRALAAVYAKEHRIV